MSTTDEPTCEHGETESHWMHCGLLNHEESDDHTCEFSWCGGPLGPTRPKAWQKRDIDVSGFPTEDAPHLSSLPVTVIPKGLVIAGMELFASDDTPRRLVQAVFYETETGVRRAVYETDGRPAAGGVPGHTIVWLR